MDPTPDALCPGCFTDPGGTHPCPHCGYDERAARPPLLLPHRALLNRQFVVGRLLGKPGGFGITYLAWDLGLHRRVAIKEYLPRELAGRGTDRATVAPHSHEDGEAFRYGLEQFLAEARTLAQLDHPNIVRVHQVFEANGTAYLAMEFYAGLTLADYLERKGGRLPESEALALMQPILDGLRAVHAKGFLHRDIKPQNIYLARLDSGGVRPILLDFGAARQAMGERSRSLSVILTEGYAPFEQYTRKGKQGVWTDVYAAGAVLYRMVTGLVPPAANDRMAEDDLAPAAAHGASAALSRTLTAALAVAPEARLRDVPALQAALWPRATIAPPPPPPPPPPARAVPAKAPVVPKPPPAAVTAPDADTSSATGAPTASPGRRDHGHAKAWRGILVVVGLVGLIIGLVLLAAKPKDDAAFAYAQRLDLASLYREYLNKCSGTGCLHRDAARARLAALEQEAAAKTQAEAAAKAEADRQAQAATERQRIEAERQARERAEAERARQARASVSEPEMVRIPAGSFLMGSPKAEPERESDEGPQHQVQVPAFELGKSEVTRGQFRTFVDATGYAIPKGCYAWTGSKWELNSAASWEAPGFTQDEGHPLVCVSWDDAQAYLAWLNKKSNKGYRLPTEAEWEYAARAGTSTAFSTGNCITTTQANYDGNYDYAGCGAKTGVWLKKTQPVGSYPANRWGLYDMHGNAWEWVQDCYHDSYTGAPKDGSEWRDSCRDSGRRVLRGGSWLDFPGLLRSADRDRNDSGDRGYNLGFRVARTLTP